MSILSQRLLSALEKQGFSHDALKRVAGECREAMERSPASEAASDHVMLYVIEDVCLQVAGWMDAVQPITLGQHDRIQGSFAPALKAAFAKLGEPCSCDEKMSQISRLIRKGRELRAR